MVYILNAAERASLAHLHADNQALPEVENTPKVTQLASDRAGLTSSCLALGAVLLQEGVENVETISCLRRQR